MADITVFTGATKGVWRVIYRFEIPNGTNAAGITFKNALKDSGMVVLSMLPDSLTSVQERTDLADGASIEVFEDLNLGRVTGANDAEKAAKRVAIMRERYEPLRQEEMKRLQGLLQYFGLNTTKA